MDRSIDPRELNRQKRKSAVISATVLLSIVILGFGFRSWIRPTLNSSDIRIARTERGPIEATTLCSGTVLPDQEQIVPCPFSSRVMKVYEDVGAQVTEGQALVQLDDTDLRFEVQQLKDQIALKKNQRRELELGLESRLHDIDGQIEIKTERLEFSVIKTQQQHALRDLGLTSIHDIQKAELDEKIARIELRQLTESLEQQRQTTNNQTQGINIEIGLLNRDLKDRISRLENATVRADRAGVLTWITRQEGATLTEGAVMARIADLSRYRVEASVSDLHVGRLAIGMPVRVVAGETTLTGSIDNIPPAIDKGVMRINIVLDQPNNNNLRANLRVDVHVVTATRNDAIRIKKGPFITGSGPHEIFVVRRGEATRQRAVFGVSGIDYYEIVSGLTTGEDVIISNMSDHIHLTSIAIR